MNNRKKSVFRWLIGGSICAACLLIGIMSLSALHKSNSHVVHYRESKRAHVLKEQFVLDMWQVERGLAQRQVQYLAELFRVQIQTRSMLDLYKQEITDWGKAHQYHDAYNGRTYMPDYEYSQGEVSGRDGTNAVKSAHTINDYQTAVKGIDANLTHLRAMEEDEADKTAWDRPHATDLQLMRYHRLSGEVIVVSFIEQAVRVYQNGKLVKAFLITSGRFGDPSPVGVWHISRRRWHTVFQSRVPVGSPNWYPDTPITYAMEYLTGGYYLHDSWWRTYYGPGTEFPHYDPAGQEFAGTGSHGCINLALWDAAWMYENTGYGTTVLTY